MERSGPGCSRSGRSAAGGSLAAVVLATAAAAIDPALRFRAALAVDCLYGTSRTEAWCLAGFGWGVPIAATVLAGAFVGLAVAVLGVRPRAVGDGDDPGARAHAARRRGTG